MGNILSSVRLSIRLPASLSLFDMKSSLDQGFWLEVTELARLPLQKKPRSTDYLTTRGQ